MVSLNHLSHINVADTKPNTKTALVMAQLCQLSYPAPGQEEYQWEVHTEDLLKNQGAEDAMFFNVGGTQCFLVINRDIIVAVFRGTQIANRREFVKDFMTDIRIRKTPGPIGGRNHRGFLAALERVWLDEYSEGGEWIKGVEQHIKDLRLEFVDPETGRQPALFLTGHSLGAALATVVAAHLKDHDDPEIRGVYLFGSPRVGDRDFARAYDQLVPSTFRYSNNNDLVTRVAPRSFGYCHVGHSCYMTERRYIVDGRRQSGWWTFLDRSLGYLLDLGEPGLDSIKDHDISEYIKTLAANALP